MDLEIRSTEAGEDEMSPSVAFLAPLRHPGASSKTSEPAGFTKDANFIVLIRVGKLPC